MNAPHAMIGVAGTLFVVVISTSSLLFAHRISSEDARNREAKHPAERARLQIASESAPQPIAFNPGGGESPHENPDRR
jgi:hypothetical protein